ncbi:hypothetical protein KUTeg_012765 [Tegillarca granosa]|uniref:Ionotropic glutamate receptor L-glutamate and glycine-binding domain-containing protein n=1 Tax=Tegillarca granosa TaxID=220873 RepID=A0ABQ9F3Z6_TEGGR|nr:hypothetical protein KUTeg_012765 [Tegillarca granosa]
MTYYPFVERRLINGTISYYGYCMDLYDVMETPDNEFGALLPNGSWTGIVGLLQRRVVEQINSK